MIEPVAMRQALAAFLGDDRFRAFVQQGLRHGKLRYWQEQEWARFTAAHPEFADGREELAVALHTGAWQDKAWRNEKRFATIAALVGCFIGGVVLVALVYACWQLYVYFHPPDGSFMQYLPELWITGYVLLFLAPLSMICGARVGLWWAQSRKLVFGSSPTPPEPPTPGIPPLG
jgi:hypothetical protein